MCWNAGQPCETEVYNGLQKNSYHKHSSDKERNIEERPKVWIGKFWLFLKFLLTCSRHYGMQHMQYPCRSCHRDDDYTCGRTQARWEQQWNLFFSRNESHQAASCLPKIKKWINTNLLTKEYRWYTQKILLSKSTSQNNSTSLFQIANHVLTKKTEQRRISDREQSLAVFEVIHKSFEKENQTQRVT